MGRTVFKNAMDTLDPKFLLEKLNVVIESLKCAAQLEVAFGFVVKNVQKRNFWHYIAHEKNTVLERSKFVANIEKLSKFKTYWVPPMLLNRAY